MSSNALNAWTRGRSLPRRGLRPRLVDLERVLETRSGYLTTELDPLEPPPEREDASLFAERLEAAREQAGITRSELARRVGASATHVGEWCAGRFLPTAKVRRGSIPRDEMLARLEGALGARPGYLADALARRFEDRPTSLSSSDEPRTFAARLERGLSFAALSGNEAARRAGIDMNTLWGWRRGSRPKPSFAPALERLEDVLGAPRGYLTRDVEETIPLDAFPTFGERLDAARRRAGLTLRQLSRASGVGFQAVQRWCAGNAVPAAFARRDVVPALERLLDTPEGYLAETVFGPAPDLTSPSQPDTLAERLRLALARARLTIHEAARRVRMCSVTLNAWCLGRMRPRPPLAGSGFLGALERVLETPPGYLTADLDALEERIDLEPLGTFGERLDLARRRARLTRERLAERVGVSVTAVAKWCAGEGRPRPHRRRWVVPRLEEVLATPQGYLADVLEREEPRVDVESLDLATFRGRLLLALHRTGYSRRDLADEVGVPATTIHAWCGSKWAPRAKYEEVVRRIEKVLGVDLAYEPRQAFRRTIPAPEEPQVEPTSFHERLDLSRRRARLSVETLAGRVGVSSSALGSWCRGTNVPSSNSYARQVEIVARLEAELGTPAGYLEAPYRTEGPAEGLDPESFSYRLAVARGRAHLTAAELADRAGVGAAAIRDWERGAEPEFRDPRIRTKLRRIEEALGTPAGYLGSRAELEAFPAELPATFQGRLRLALRRARMWQTDAAREAGISPQVLQKWCTGTYQPGLFNKDVIAALEVILETPEGFLRSVLPNNMRGDLQIRSWTKPQTYGDLQETIGARAREAEKSQESIDVILSTLAQWQRVHGLVDPSSPVGGEFGDGYAAALARFVEVRRGEVKEKTVKEQASRLGWIRDVCCQDVPETFAGRLRLAFKSSAVTCHAASLFVGFTPGTVRGWMDKGQLPMASSIPAVRELEKYLGTPEGYLVDALPARLRGAGTPAHGESRYGKQIVRARLGFYGVWNDRVAAQFEDLSRYKTVDAPEVLLSEDDEVIQDGWSVNSIGRRPSEELAKSKLRQILGYACLPRDDAEALARAEAARAEALTLLGEETRSAWASGDVEARIALLVAFKAGTDEAHASRVALAADRFLRSSVYGLERERIVEMSSDLELAFAIRSWLRSAVSSDEFLQPKARQRVETGARFVERLVADADRDRQFWRGLGRDPEEATLAWLTDRRLVEGYLEFRYVRSGGVFSKAHELVITTLTHLLRKKTGWLWRRADLRFDLGRDLSEADWRHSCKALRKYLFRVLSKLEPHKRLSRSHDRIEDILRLDEPMSALVEAGRRILDDWSKEKARREESGKTVPSVREARLYRDALLVLLVTSNPLRALQFANMQWDRHLYRRDDGSWWLRYHRSEFKNRKALKEDYDVDVNENLWHHVTTYRETYHPVLAGGSEEGARFVFVSATNGKSPSGFTPESLSARFELSMLVYLPGSGGFRMHSARHIVATDIIKTATDGGGILRAARALHDKTATVEKAYAHLKPHEERKPANRHFSDRYRGVFGAGNGSKATSAGRRV